MLGGHRELLLHPKEAEVLQPGGEAIDEGEAGEGADLYQEPEEEKVFPEN